MKAKMLVMCLILFSIFAIAQESPYSGEESRQVKSLSESDIKAYLNGSGLGYAKAAELNHYPGPSHVLELAVQIDLSEQQHSETEALFTRMQEQASDLGRRYVDKEAELDEAFSSGTIASAKLRSLLEEIAGIESAIRFVHLNAHLEQSRILTADQARLYDQLRGYGVDHDQHSHH